MSETTTSNNKFNKKFKFEVSKVKFSKKRSEGEEDTKFKPTSRSNSRDGSDGSRGYGVDSSDLKRKRVYGGGGVEKDGEKGFSRKKKDDVSDSDRLSRAKFSSSRGGSSGNKEFDSSKGYKGRSGRKDEFSEGRKDFDESSRGYKGRSGRKDEFSEGRSGKKEFESSRGFKGRVDTRDGRREEGVGSGLKAKFNTRERWGSTKREGNEESGVKFNTEGKTRERWPSTKRDEVSDGKFKSQGKTRDSWASNQGDDVSDSKLKSKSVGGGYKGASSRQDDSEDGFQKQHSRNKTDLKRGTGQEASNDCEVGRPVNFAKKYLRPKKYAEDNSLTDDPPKKKIKMAMRIDPKDISNKRLDDGISNNGKTAEKNIDPDKDSEISKNAQFRAIQPSPSILSFVEENLLGRRRSIDLRKAGYNIDLSAPLDNIPLSTSSERERIEEAVFRNKMEFIAAAKISSSFPPAELPEIAFAGRSNVGKSSLLNALTRQWGVVRTSDKPGLTQTINFFKLGSKLCMVDLPGYGFAYAKEEVKDAWEELVKEYVSTRVGLKRVCLLIDTKWGMKPRDHELINLMEKSQTKYQIVLTKSDLVFPIDVARRAMQIEESLKANKSVVQPLMMASAKSGGGIRSLRTVLAKIARFAR